MASRVRILRSEQLQAKLKKLRENAMPDVLPAMEKAAGAITDMMRRQVAVKSGKLRDSINWTYGDAPKGAMHIRTIVHGESTITIYAGGKEEKVPNAWWVEFGTRPHPNLGQFPGTQHPGSPAQPFFFTSYRALKKETKRMIRRAISASVKKVARS